MIKTTWLELKRTVLAISALALLLCIIYPLAVWGIARLFFPAKAAGSLVVIDNRIRGSVLIGQRFTGPGFFHPRPSAAGEGYDAMASGGSNLGPLSKALIEQVARRVKEYREENHVPPGVPIPVDAVTASASGLDPHISAANAILQAARVAQAGRLDKEKVLASIAKCTENRQLGIFGEKRVNVLLLNLELLRLVDNNVCLRIRTSNEKFLPGPGHAARATAQFLIFSSYQPLDLLPSYLLSFPWSSKAINYR